MPTNSAPLGQDELSPRSKPTQAFNALSMSLSASGIAEEDEEDFLPMNSVNGPASPFNFGSHGFQPDAHAASLSESQKREHSRRHSRIHSRNLSVFFPRPDQSFNTIPEDASPSGESDTSPVDIPSASLKSWAGSSSNQYTSRRPFGSQNDLNSSQSEGISPNKASSRRGHHHRHSLSHNFFPFLETPSEPSSGFVTPNSADAVKSVPSSLNLASSVTPSSLPLSSTAISLRTRYAHLPTLVRFFLAIGFHIPFSTQLALALSSLEMALGAMLWIFGQSGESLAVTGLGYLVVFDALGAFCSVIVEGNAKDVDIIWEMVGPSASRAGDCQLRYPFGTYRLTTLAQFAQCIYLLFSAVYVCKESIEHVLLLHDPTEELTTAAGKAQHGSAHGSMGHGEGRGSPIHELKNAIPEGWVEIGVTMPTGLLLLSTLLCLMTAFFLSNHASLTEAVGPSTYALRPRPRTSQKSRSPFAAILSLLSNPFSLLVLVFSFALSTASITIPAMQLAPLDKVLALLESVAMFYVAYPAAEATGKVLLQTAPPADAEHMALLTRGLRDLESHPLVIFIPQPHVWQLTPHPKSDTSSSSSKSLWKSTRRPAQSQGASILVVTVKIHIRENALDRDVLDITQLARDKCAPALKGNDGPPGELTVAVCRGMDQDDHCSHDTATHNQHGHATNHSQHPHSHSHSHSQASAPHH